MAALRLLSDHTELRFDYLLPVLKTYSIRDVYCRFSVLTVIILECSPDKLSLNRVQITPFISRIY